MESWSSAWVSAFLLLAAAGLMLLHVRTWRRAQRQRLDREEIEFRWRQFRRRMQTSALLAVLAVAIFVGSLISGPVTLVLAFWGVTLLLVFWLVLLAGADALATKLHFARLRDDCFVEQARLHRELRRIRAAQGNGKPSEKQEERS